MRAEPLLLALLALSAPLAAEPPVTAENAKDAREAEASLELLEFLGSWETATGAWNETMPDDERAATPSARRPKETTRDED